MLTLYTVIIYLVIIYNKYINFFTYILLLRQIKLKHILMWYSETLLDGLYRRTVILETLHNYPPCLCGIYWNIPLFKWVLNLKTLFFRLFQRIVWSSILDFPGRHKDRLSLLVHKMSHCFCNHFELVWLSVNRKS